MFQSKAINFLHSIDFIGREPKLKMNKRPRNQTVMGGLLCIMMFCIFIPAALYFGQELVFQVLPKVIETSIPTAQNDFIELSKEHFTFFLYLEDSTGQMHSIDNYLNAKVNRITVNQDNGQLTHTSTPIEFKQCTSKDFLQSPASSASSSFGELSLSQIDKWKCINQPQQSLTIQSTRHYSTYSYITLSLSKCINGTPQCKSDADIATFLNKSILILKYYDTNYNQREFKNYSQSVMKESPFSLMKGIAQQVYFTLQITNFYTDIGYMFEDFRLKSFHNIKSIYTMNFPSEDPMTSNSDYSIKFNFLLDYSKSVNYRKYYKFQNWVAELGGIVKAISLIATIINYFNDKSEYYERLINELFDVDDVLKYFQYSDIDNLNTASKKKKKRDSVVLLNAKKEKDFFRRGYNNRSNVFDLKQSPSRCGQSNNYLSKNSLKKFNSLNNNGDNVIESSNLSNINNYYYTSKSRLEPSVITPLVPMPTQIPGTQGVPVQGPGPGTVPSAVPESIPEKSKVGSNSESDPHEAYIENLKKNRVTKEHFDKVKKHRFSINMFEMFVFCFCSKKENPKYNALMGGRHLIIERSDIVYILRKNLELDRFKNLILRDHQLLLLNSLTKFMLDPERVNLIDFQYCNYDKFIDAFDSLTSITNMIDVKLAKWVETKFRFEHSSLTTS